MEVAADTDRALLTRRIAKAPHVARHDVFVGEAVVLREILRHLRRAMRAQVWRRCAGYEARLPELARHQVVRAGRADADGEIETFLDQVDDAVRQRHVEAHLGVGGEKRGDRRRQMAHAEIDRARELDRAAGDHRRAARLLLGLLQLGEELHAAFVEGPAALREADATGRAVEQARLQVGLEVGDVPGCSSSRQTQPRRRGGETPRFNDLRENPHRLPPVHAERLQRISG